MGACRLFRFFATIVHHRNAETKNWSAISNNCNFFLTAGALKCLRPLRVKDKFVLFHSRDGQSLEIYKPSLEIYKLNLALLTNLVVPEAINLLCM